MEFDWEEENLQHIALHNVTAAEAEFVLQNPPTLDLGYQDWHDQEERFAEVGATANGRILTIITTWRGIKTRVITAYDAPISVADEYYRQRMV